MVRDPDHISARLNSGEVIIMGKAYCPKCKKTLNEVFSSFECLATWDKAEKFYTPGDNCNLVRRCTKCGTLTKEQKKDYSLLNKPPQLQRPEQ